MLGPGGEGTARVIGSRHLAVDDQALEAVLGPHRERLARIIDDPSWDAALIDILERAGYRVVR